MPFTAINVRREPSINSEDSIARTELQTTPKTTSLKSRLPARDSTAKSMRGQAFMQISLRQTGALQSQQFQKDDNGARTTAGADGVRAHYLDIPDDPAVYPREYELKDCGMYLQSLSELGNQRGMVRIKPPKSVMPKYNLASEQFLLKTRRQTINDKNTTSQLKRDFLEALLKFYDQNIADVETLKSPIVNGRLVDLYNLHRAVQLRGGFQEVGRNKQWSQIAREMGLAFIGHTNAFRMLYQRLLFPFDEFLYSHGVTLSASPKMVRIYVAPEGAAAVQGEVTLSGGITVSTDCSSVSAAGVIENSAHCYRRLATESSTVHSQPKDEDIERLYELKTYSLKQFNARALKFAQTYFKGPQSANDIENEFWRLVNEPKECIEVEQGSSIVSDCCTPTSLWSWASQLISYTTNSFFRWIAENSRGFCDPYIGVDMLFTSDNWHLTDFGTHELHIHHLGSCKTYYSTSPKDYELVRSLFPDGFGDQINCLEIMKRNNVELHATDLSNGEILVLFPRSFVCSFSHGFNLVDVTYVPLGYQWLSEAAECSKAFAAMKIEPPLSFDKLMFTCLYKIDSFAAFMPCKSMRDAFLESELEVATKLAKLAVEVVQIENSEGVECDQTKVWRWLSWVEEVETGKFRDPKSFCENFDANIKYKLHVREPATTSLEEAFNEYTQAAELLEAIMLTLYSPPQQLDSQKVTAEIESLGKSKFQDLAAFGQRMISLARESALVRSRLLDIRVVDGKVTAPVSVVFETLQDTLNQSYGLDSEGEQHLVALLSLYKIYGEQVKLLAQDVQFEMAARATLPSFHTLLQRLKEAYDQCPFVSSPQQQGILDAIKILSELASFLETNDIYHLRYHDVCALYQAYQPFANIGSSKLYGELSACIKAANVFSGLVEFYSEVASSTTNVLQTIGVMLEMSRAMLVAPATIQALRALEYRLLTSAVGYTPLETRARLSDFGTKYLDTAETMPARRFCELWTSSWPAQAHALIAQVEDARTNNRSAHTLTFDWRKALTMCRQLYQMGVVPDNVEDFMKLEALLLAVELQSR